MTSMREKIARVLAVRDGMHPEAVSNDEDQVPAWTLYLDDADAALDALMEPTEGMFRAGYEKDIMALRGCDSIFVAMITAAKGGK